MLRLVSANNPLGLVNSEPRVKFGMLGVFLTGILLFFTKQYVVIIKRNLNYLFMGLEKMVDYNLKERCEIIQLAILASQDLNASQLIKWFENHIEKKQKKNFFNSIQSIEEFYEATKV